ncbi:GNAT family N-acetyltransferase [Terrabacter aerolatus]|uniref:N-acetyltransferase n=1 Tax=Terrabacter aerolatus TaxID=422442 RepID=A0A512CXM6_9MICO|nr:GNAT family N-acetyltransferase [Terrabacter aerolatus]GEO28951.1 N-acetyltransferase [Terrabacter aerolatus]
MDPAGEVVAAFMHTPPHPLHVALATPAQARALAAHLAGTGDRPPGVGGLRGAAEAFADEWTARTGACATVTMEVGRFDLPVRPRVPFAVAGSFRPATVADAALLELWHQDFVDAIEGGGRAASSLERHVADGRVGLWEVDGRPVSMAYASPASGGVTRISGVWTPPGRRGHGYASAVVAALSSARMDRGEACMLFTDLANPTSNAIYRALGYRRVGDNISIVFSSANGAFATDPSAHDPAGAQSRADHRPLER